MRQEVIEPALWAMVLRHLAKYCDPPREPELLRSDTLLEELGLGSLQSIELVMSLEDELDVAIEDDELLRLVTVGDVARLLAITVSQRAAKTSSKGDLAP